MLIFVLYRCRLTEVNADSVAQDGLTIPYLANGDGGLDAVEGDDDAAEGFERSKGMDRDGLRNEIADDIEVLGLEDFEVIQVGEEQGVGWRCGLLQWGKFREVEGQVGLVAGGSGRRS